MGTIYLLAARRGLLEGMLLKLRRSELTLNSVENAINHLILISSHIGIPAGDWNVQSTLTQFALGRVIVSLENFELHKEFVEQAENPHQLEWAEISVEAREGARIVAALGAALCSRDLSLEARRRAEQEIASEIPQLIAKLSCVRSFLERLWMTLPVSADFSLRNGSELDFFSSSGKSNRA